MLSRTFTRRREGLRVVATTTTIGRRDVRGGRGFMGCICVAWLLDEAARLGRSLPLAGISPDSQDIHVCSRQMGFVWTLNESG